MMIPLSKNKKFVYMRRYNFTLTLTEPCIMISTTLIYILTVIQDLHP